MATIVTSAGVPASHPSEQGYVLGFAFLAVIGVAAGATALLVPSALRAGRQT